MSNSTTFSARRTPLSQLHNATPLMSDKTSISQDNLSKGNSNSSFFVSSNENTKEENEYVKTLKSALREAAEENDLLKNRVTEIEALLSAAQDEIEQRDKAILELAAKLESRNQTRTKTPIRERNTRSKSKSPEVQKKKN